MRLFPCLVKLEKMLGVKEKEIEEKLRSSLETQMIQFNEERYKTVIMAFYQSESATQWAEISSKREDFMDSEKIDFETRPLILINEFQKIIASNIRTIARNSLKEALSELESYTLTERSHKAVKNLQSYFEAGVKIKMANITCVLTQDVLH